MSPVELLRLLGPMVLAILAAFTIDALCARRGLFPPGFHRPLRRAAADTILAALLWIGVFLPLGNIGLDNVPEITRIYTPELFLLHFLMVATLLAWFLLGFGGLPSPQSPRPEAPAAPVPVLPPDGVVPEPGVEAVVETAAGTPLPEGLAAPVAPPPLSPILPPHPSLGRRFAEQFGFVAPSVPREIGLGLSLGLASWIAVLVAVIIIGGLLLTLGGEDALPKQPPAVVPLIAALPFFIRLLLSLSAGVVEETFFRGFLQPRIGIALSTGFFVLAHFSYGQPFMLIGITILSLIYAFLVRWRQSVWAAIAAHALFDSVQLLVVIPAALRLLEGQGRLPGGTGLLGSFPGLWPG